MERYIIEPQGGIRIEAKKGQSIAIKDIEGGQVADFFAEIQGTHEEYLSPSVTLDCNESLHVGVGTILYSNLYHPMFEVIYDDVERHDLLFPSSMFFFLLSGEKLAGYLKVNEAPSQTDVNDPASLEIERIYVSGEFQGEGLGRYLMEQAISMAVERKKKYVWLGVWEKNEKAIRFYKRNGFCKIGTHSFVMGDDVQTDHIMRKDLSIS